MKFNNNVNVIDNQDLTRAITNSFMMRRSRYDPNNLHERYDIGNYLKNIEMSTFEISTKPIISKKIKNQIEGTLEKQSPSFFVFWWQKRYCILRNNCFIYYDDDTPDSKIAGIINFNAVSTNLMFTENNQNEISNFKLIPSDTKKEFIFRGSTHEITMDWIKAIEKAIDSSIGKKSILTSISHYERFWRKNYFTETEFRVEANTGDLILFRSGKRKTIFKKRITKRYNFDHIAIILKNTNQEILLLEAADEGTFGIIPWSKLIEKYWYKDQDIIVYRRLQIERTHAFLQQIKKFAHQKIKGKYKTIKKIKSLFEFSSEEVQLLKEKKKIASELIVELFIKLQLLSNNIDDQYTPDSFSQQFNLVLKTEGKFGPAHLREQKLIIFQDTLIKKKITIPE